MQFHRFLLDDYMHTREGGRVKRFFAYIAAKAARQRELKARKG